MKINNVWFITPKTNLHVGNENTSSYGLIDLAVQRNATTELPCINSSSLKGALNEYAANAVKLSSCELIRIFGSDKTDKTKGSQKGQYTFFDADILFLPKQSDTQLYELVTCDEVLERFFSQVELLTGEKLTVEDLGGFNYKPVLLEEFNELCSDDNLPIIARNVLENGESKNLWYEQVVPAETVFYTLIDDHDDEVLANLLKEKAIVQIGANATIGYGYCKFTQLKKS